jgi:TonB family protein
MFAPLIAEAPARKRNVMASSLVIHGLLFAWLLHTPEPPLLNASSVAPGRNGRVLAQIYFPSPLADDSTSSSPQSATEVYRHQRFGHEKLLWKKNHERVTQNQPTPPQLAPSGAEDKSQTATLSNLGHGAPAGLPYGSVPGSAIFGDEVRPALPVTTVDPVVYPWELPPMEGNVVVEITIDERGTIVRKTVLRSMGEKLDDRFLAALDQWHFQPATRNGVAIVSKQDAIFHYKARG